MAKRAPKYQHRKEVQELETAYQKAAKKPGKKAPAVIILVLLLIISICVLAGCFGSSKLEDGIIMNNVTVAGINVGGMSKEEAASAIRLSAADSYTTNPMVVVIVDQQVELSPEVTKASLDVEAAVEAAYGIGRTGSRAERKEMQLLAATTGVATDISDCLYVDRDAIVAALNAANITPSAEITESAWEIVGDLPDLTTEEAPTETQTLLIKKGIPAFDYEQEALLEQIMQSYADHAFVTEFTCEMSLPAPLNLASILQQYAVEPADAVMDTETFEVIPHSYGYGFDLEAAQLALDDAMFGQEVSIPFTTTAPEQTAEALSSLLFRDVLAKHKATSGSSKNRDNNLKLACQAIDGTVILPGEVFDYNKTTGERTTAKGYLPASGYAGGKTVQMVGGGVCQPSSIIYYCALLADMEIVTRANHQFISSYMDPGMDATVSWGGPHFRFRNNTEYPIRIDATASGGSVTIAIVGTDTKDHYVKMEYEILDKRGWSTETIELPADNEEGYKDGEVISTPYTGYTVKTYRCRYSKADDSLIERVFEAKSVYDSRNKQVVKIIPDATEPPEETTKPTDPPTTQPPATEAPTDPPAPDTQPPESGGDESIE